MTSHDHGRSVIDALHPLHRDLRRAIPEQYAGYAQLHRAALADGALSTRTKELMAFVIGVVEGCDGCMATHAQGAVRAGATRQEAAEAIGVALLMRGGPASVYGPRGYAAFCELADEQERRLPAQVASGAPYEI